MIITLSGLVGSGGEEIGKRLEELLHYRRVGHELVERAAKLTSCDLGEPVKQFYDEDMDLMDQGAGYTKALLKLELDVLPTAQMEKANFRHYSDERARRGEAQRQAVMEYAQEGNVILMGRCSSFYLQGREDCVNLFTIDDLDARRRRAAEFFAAMSERELHRIVDLADKRRADYYEHYTNRPWRNSENYDYVINVGCLGVEKTAQWVAALVSLKESK